MNVKSKGITHENHGQKLVLKLFQIILQDQDIHAERIQVHKSVQIDRNLGILMVISLNFIILSRVLKLYFRNQCI